MAAFGGLVLTIKGRNLQAKVQAGQQLKFSRMGLGDGVITSQSIPNMTGLITERKSIAVSRVYTPSAGRATVSAILSNQDITTGFFFRELGVFAVDPDEGEIMYAYGNSGSGSAEYIPPGGGADVIEKLINVNLLVGNATNISITADPSQVYVSLQDYTDYTTSNDVNILDLKNRMTTVETDVDDLQNRLNNVDTKRITLAGGVQVLNSIKSALFSLDGITGRMMVNLLGRMGNCENVGSWSSNVAIVSDATNKTSGTSSFKLTVGSVPATASATFLTTPGKKYVAIADVKNGNTSKVAISINGIAGASGNEVTSASAFAPSVVRFVATDYFHILTITGTGASGNTFNMDSVRVHEVSDADYAAAATLTPAQVAAKWPYVDSVMPVRNPYAIRYGENLLPSFYEWTLVETKATEPYAAAMTPTVSNRVTYYETSTAPGNVYTLSAQHNGNIALSFLDSSGNVIGTPSYTTSQMVSGTAPANAQRMRVSFSNLTVTTGTLNISNPMLNIGSTEKPFKPREDSMLALQTDLYADPVTGANTDMVFERDGQYFKSKKWQGLTLDGNRAWVQGEGGATAGVRQVKLVGAAIGAVAGSGIGVKFDGKIIPQGSTGNTADSNAVTAAGDIYFGIPVADSGWADSYGPSQDDIKAYFFGYKAYDANTITPANAQASTTATWNGTGTKYWVQRVGAPNFTQTVPQQAYAGYTPYQLVYQLATPAVEPIVSEGLLSFNEGDNQVEVGTGIVLRESARPKLHTNGFYYINNSNVAGTNLTYSVSKVLGIYKGLRPDTEKWALYIGSGSTNGTTAEASAANYDAAAAYSVTYLVLAPSPVVPFTGSYAANEKTLLSDLVDSVQQNTARVSVLENKKADEDNPAWLTPTLLNGWVVWVGSQGTYTPGYYKDSAGVVHLRGWVKDGVKAQATVIFRLPVGYRPSQRSLFTVYDSSDTGTNLKTSAVVVNVDGSVSVDAVSGTSVSFYQVSFLAEQ
ncbi:phage tail protein [Paenibacillus sp. FSL M8-0228]|uniref:phage tail-collar fiber domain-containing protein n=1 Tax=Paenibacillus sp. FSL M8-0228 TaxID=2921620 RepID=UPI0030FAD032